MNYEKIAKSNRPYAAVFAYDTDSHYQGDVLSTHSTHKLASAAAARSGYETFLTIRDARDYV